MPEAKNNEFSVVHITYDGRVSKTFRGTNALQRFTNEERVLRYLEARGCTFVPRVLAADAENLKLVTTNCGGRVERISEDRLRQLFFSLEQYGVRHDDPFLRNVTYRESDGRFCIIDFEFATILEDEGKQKPVTEQKLNS
ncbi:MAG: serine/threonine protein phosphatase [Verrucomicrobiota bacterium]|nr:serine/threonine protein phosphatase [Verrucomicrobiota bacterium]